MSATKPLVLVGLLAVTACASNPAPKGALPREENVDKTGYGGWIYIERNAAPVVQGELIAASDDSVVVLTANGVQPVARDVIRHAEVAVFDARMAGLQTWLALGTVATISNGFFLLLTAPMWLIGGGASLARVSKQPIYKWQSNQPLSSLAQFARFAGGVPESVDRATLTFPIFSGRQ